MKLLPRPKAIRPVPTPPFGSLRRLQPSVESMIQGYLPLASRSELHTALQKFQGHWVNGADTRDVLVNGKPAEQLIQDEARMTAVLNFLHAPSSRRTPLRIARASYCSSPNQYRYVMLLAPGIELHLTYTALLTADDFPSRSNSRHRIDRPLLPEVTLVNTGLSGRLPYAYTTAEQLSAAERLPLPADREALRQQARRNADLLHDYIQSAESAGLIEDA